MRTFNNNHFNKKAMLIGFLLVLLISCGGNSTHSLPLSQNGSSLPATSSPSDDIATAEIQLLSSSPTIVYSPTQIPSASPTISPATRTPLPTLVPSESQALIQDLLANNGGCKFPCWWGITPGKTTWEEADKFLSTFASQKEYINSSPNQPSFVGWFKFNPYEDREGSNFQTYTVDKGKIELIEIVFSDVPSLTLSDLLTRYGPPDGIWIRTFGTEYNGSIPFYLVLYYSNQVILALFISNNASLDDGHVQKCFEKDFVNEIALLPEKRNYSFEEAGGQTEDFKFDDGFPLISLEDATDLNSRTFYNLFKVADKPVCLETPANLWPGQYE